MLTASSRSTRARSFFSHHAVASENFSLFTHPSRSPFRVIQRVSSTHQICYFFLDISGTEFYTNSNCKNVLQTEGRIVNMATKKAAKKAAKKPAKKTAKKKK